MRVLKDHQYGAGAGLHLDRLGDGGEQLWLGGGPALVKEVGLAQQVG